MSETPTPRTDEARLDENDPYQAMAHECGKMERELAAANKERDDALMMLGVYKLGCEEQNERIRRLTEAGDEMARQFCHPTMQTHQWNKAKEARP